MLEAKANPNAQMSLNNCSSDSLLLQVVGKPKFVALPLVKPVVWFARAVVNWRSRSVAKSAFYKVPNDSG